jgi:alpha-ribazole phosphatase
MREDNGALRLLFLRHGRTEGNLNGRYVGRTDEPLASVGADELRRAAKEAERFHPSVVISSPMLRCTQSEEILFPGIRPILIPEFSEINFGSFEGHTYEELKDRWDYQRWLDSGGTLPFPNGESMDSYRKRVLKGAKILNEILLSMRYGKRQDTILAEADTEPKPESFQEETAADAALIVHGGTMMALFSALATPERSYFDWHTEHGCGYLVRWTCGTSERTDAFPARLYVEREICLNRRSE